MALLAKLIVLLVNFTHIVVVLIVVFEGLRVAGSCVFTSSKKQRTEAYLRNNTHLIYPLRRPVLSRSTRGTQTIWQTILNPLFYLFDTLFYSLSLKLKNSLGTWVLSSKTPYKTNTYQYPNTRVLYPKTLGTQNYYKSCLCPDIKIVWVLVPKLLAKVPKLLSLSTQTFWRTKWPPHAELNGTILTLRWRA